MNVLFCDHAANAEHPHEVMLFLTALPPEHLGPDRQGNIVEMQHLRSHEQFLEGSLGFQRGEKIRIEATVESFHYWR